MSTTLAILHALAARENDQPLCVLREEIENLNPVTAGIETWTDPQGNVYIKAVHIPPDLARDIEGD